MRIRIAALSATIIFASLFFYIGQLGAQSIFQPFSGGGGEPPIFPPPGANGNPGGMGCRLAGVEKYHDGGSHKWVTTDKFQWVEVWIDYRAQGKDPGHPEGNLRIDNSYKFVQFYCDEDRMVISDVFRRDFAGNPTPVTLIFNVRQLAIYQIDGLPAPGKRPVGSTNYNTAYFSQQ